MFIYILLHSFATSTFSNRRHLAYTSAYTLVLLDIQRKSKNQRILNVFYKTKSALLSFRQNHDKEWRIIIDD